MVIFVDHFCLHLNKTIPEVFIRLDFWEYNSESVRSLPSPSPNKRKMKSTLTSNFITIFPKI